MILTLTLQACESDIESKGTTTGRSERDATSSNLHRRMWLTESRFRQEVVSSLVPSRAGAGSLAGH